MRAAVFVLLAAPAFCASIFDYAASPRTPGKVVGAYGTDTPNYRYEAFAQVITQSIGGLSWARCGGVLIAPSVVLTAAHCVNLAPQTRVHVKLGHRAPCDPTGCPDSPAGPHAEVVVGAAESVDVHPAYNASIVPSTRDLALVFLDTPATGVRPAALDFAGSLYGFSNFTFMGLGRDHAGQTPTELQLAILVPKSCPFGDGLMCAGGAVQLFNSTHRQGAPYYADACSGDSGGPLFATVQAPWSRWFPDADSRAFGWTDCAPGATDEQCGAGGMVGPVVAVATASSCGRSGFGAFSMIDIPWVLARCAARGVVAPDAGLALYPPPKPPPSPPSLSSEVLGSVGVRRGDRFVFSKGAPGNVVISSGKVATPLGAPVKSACGDVLPMLVGSEECEISVGGDVVSAVLVSA